MDRATWLKQKRRRTEDGYHYYPRIEQVRAWVDAAHFVIQEEAVGDDYHHFLTHKA